MLFSFFSYLSLNSMAFSGCLVLCGVNPNKIKRSAQNLLPRVNLELIPKRSRFKFGINKLKEFSTLIVKMLSLAFISGWLSSSGIRFEKGLFILC